VDFVVGKQPVALDLPGVEHLAAQRQDGLVSLSRPILALPPAESPSTRNTSLCAMSRLSQSVSLPGSTATPEPLRFSTFWPGLLARLRGLDGQFGQLFAVFHVLVQPQLQRGAHKADTSRTASREFRRSLIWPWNCGSSTLAEST
jgi:hypothetical protein